MTNDNRVVLYSTILKLLDDGKFVEVSDIIKNLYDSHETQADLSLIMGTLRLSYLYQDQIQHWYDIAQSVYEKLDNSENLMRGLL